MKKKAVYLALLRKEAARQDAPNYRKMDERSGKSCATCQFLDSDTGQCLSYSFKVNPDWVCDTYASGNGVAPSRETFGKDAAQGTLGAAVSREMHVRQAFLQKEFLDKQAAIASSDELSDRFQSPPVPLRPSSSPPVRDLLDRWRHWYTKAKPAPKPLAGA